jgi:hypothetical protein
VRFGLIVLAVAALASPARARPNNPTFLGIAMQDLGGRGPCLVTLVTPDSGAEDAHLLRGDLMLTIDGKQVANCDEVLRAIVAHEAGDWVQVGVARGASRVAVKAQVLTRDEVLARRLVGRNITGTTAATLDEPPAAHALATEGNAAIIAWFDPDRCSDCASLIGRAGHWARARTAKRGLAIDAYAVAAAPADLKELRPVQKKLDVPLYALGEEAFRDYTIDTIERVVFVVVDGRGVVQHVASIGATADDTDALLDDLYAAAEQAARHLR